MPSSPPCEGHGVRAIDSTPLAGELCSAPDHLASLREGISYPAWAPAGAGAFGASLVTQALGRG
jgi:hypothetical protein